MTLRIDIAKKFEGFDLNINLETKEGWLGLLGASGAGKSLTLKVIAGIITPDRGTIVLNDRILFDSEKKINLSPQERRLGYLFQSYALFPHMTVEENIAFVIKEGRASKDIKTEELIELFHLKGLEKSYPRELSGGQQQRTALARIIASEAEVLLLDEPFSAMDSYLREELLEELLPAIKAFTREVILVTHDREEAYRLCQDVAIISSGTIINQGTTEKLFKNPRKVEAAKLLGISNISSIKRISDFEVRAIAWGVNLILEERVQENIRHIAINSNSIKPLCIKNIGLTNVLRVSLVETINRPFDLELIIKSKNSHGKLRWVINKEKWQKELNGSLPEYLYLPPEELILLE
ncbi:MAG: sulfate/molybdate ABC transporter ATP-binding protein [Clostridiaceae bacterium]